MQEQYVPCNCPSCQKLKAELSVQKSSKNQWEQIKKTAFKAFEKLYQKKKYQPQELFQTPEYKELITQTADVFNQTISYEVSEELKAHLQQGNLVFSALKTHTQLTEARGFLTDENGGITPFYKFQKQVEKLNNAYNQNYLEAEYEFAVQSAQSVEAWQNFSDDTQRYWLEYRTAGDEKVRANHDALRGVCLPKNDPFWKSYFPPLGWRCRCVAVEVLASENQLSDSQYAQQIGERATTQISENGKNKLAMFRFNPALEKTLFPPKNSYTKVVGAEQVRKEVEKSTQAKLREKYLKEMEPLLKKSVYKKVENKEIKIRFTKKGNKHLYSDTFGRANFDKEELKNIDQKLQNSKFVKTSELSKQRKDNIVKFYYFKDENEELYYNVAEELFTKKNGIVKLNYFLYSITNKIKSVRRSLMLYGKYPHS